jgi:hypothetical protein
MNKNNFIFNALRIDNDNKNHIGKQYDEIIETDMDFVINKIIPNGLSGIYKKFYKYIIDNYILFKIHAKCSSYSDEHFKQSPYLKYYYKDNFYRGKQYMFKNNIKFIDIVNFFNSKERLRGSLIKFNKIIGAKNNDVINKSEYYKENQCGIYTKIILFGDLLKSPVISQIKMDFILLKNEILKLINNNQKNHIEKQCFNSIIKILLMFADHLDLEINEEPLNDNL